MSFHVERVMAPNEGWLVSTGNQPVLVLPGDELDSLAEACSFRLNVRYLSEDTTGIVAHVGGCESNVAKSTVHLCYTDEAASMAEKLCAFIPDGDPNDPRRNRAKPSVRAIRAIEADIGKDTVAEVVTYLRGQGIDVDDG